MTAGYDGMGRWWWWDCRSWDFLQSGMTPLMGLWSYVWVEGARLGLRWEMEMEEHGLERWPLGGDGGWWVDLEGDPWTRGSWCWGRGT